MSTDRIGTASAWVEVPDLAHSKLEMSSIILRNPVESDPINKLGINVSELEQVKIVRGIPVYSRSDVFDYLFCAYYGTQSYAKSDLTWMTELFREGKLIKQQPWVPMANGSRNMDGKREVDAVGKVDLNGLDPGIYELRISVKCADSDKTMQRAAVFGVE